MLNPLSANQPFDRKQLRKAVHIALRNWRTIANAEETLLASLLIVRQAREAYAGALTPLAKRQITNEILATHIQDLIDHDPEDARFQILEQHFIQGKTLTELAEARYQAESTLNKWQAQAIDALTEMMEEHEKDARQQYRHQQEIHLPSALKTELFGVTKLGQVMVEQLMTPEEHGLMVISGLGGIGKSALAYMLADRAIAPCLFSGVIWLTAVNQAPDGQLLSPQNIFADLLNNLAKRLEIALSNTQELLGHIQNRLRQRPYLIIFDNLETPDALAYLLSQITGFSQPSKILITSRAQPETAPNITHHHLNELTADDTISFLKYLIPTTTPEDAQTIYNVVGGNPYALKLVASLQGRLPLSQILNDIVQANAGKSEAMFRYIYWLAWRNLSPLARQLLLSMPLVVDSASLPQMQRMSRLDDEGLTTAVLELLDRSLLLAKGNQQEIRYGIHRLTETFLRTEIINWDDTE